MKFNCKKFLVTSLSLLRLATAIPFNQVFASTKVNSRSENEGNIFSENKIEYINKEGQYYTYKYQYNNKSQKEVDISNKSNNSSEVLTFDDVNEKVYLYEKLVAEITNNPINKNNNNTM